MRISRHRAFPLVVVALALPSAGACADAGEFRSPGGQSASGSVADRVDDDGEPANHPAEDPAVDSLTNELGRSEAQATRQMQTQVAAGRAEHDLPPRLAAVFSDLEIQHDQGGRVVVAMTDRRLADAMIEHFAGHGVSDVEIRIVRPTNRHLDATAEALQQRLRDSRDPQDTVYVAVGRAALGKVTVEFVDGPMNATEAEIVSEARAEPDTFVVTEVDHIEVGEEE